MNKICIGSIVSAVVVLLVIGILIPTVILDTNDETTTPVSYSTTPASDSTTPTEEFCTPFKTHFHDILFNDGSYLEIKNHSSDARWPHYYPDYKVTGYLLNVTSLNYLTPEDSTVPTWFHRVAIFVPDEFDNSINPKTGLPVSSNVFIRNEGGSNRESDGTAKPDGVSIDDSMSMNLVKIASNTGTISVRIRDNPNEPVVFKNDASGMVRTEDEIIAYTWGRYLDKKCNGHDCMDWLLNLQMTKVITNVFDAVTDFVKTNDFHDKIISDLPEIKSYVISGESKRGWTSWLACGMDDRCSGAAPVVMDLIKMHETLHMHYRALGGWSFVFSPYYHENLTLFLDTESFTEMECVLDPWEMFDNLIEREVPVFYTGATGDEFFMLQDALSYADEAKYEKGLNLWMRYLHNTEHVMATAEIWQAPYHDAIAIFYSTVAQGTWDSVLPKYSWKSSQNSKTGEILMKSDQKPDKIKAFMAETRTSFNPANDRHAKDFRLARVEQGLPVPQLILWTRDDYSDHIEELDNANNDDNDGHQWLISFAVPDAGRGKTPFRAFYGEMDFNMSTGRFGGDDIFTISTPANIMPDELPFEDCHDEGCYGELV